MFNNSPDKRRRGARPEEMRRRLLAVHGLLAGRTRLTSWRYEKVLRECTPADLVYMDPPYQGTCGRRDRRYWGEFSHSGLCDELEKLDRRHVPFVLSYDGRLGRRTYGRDLPESLGLRRIVIRAGRPAQSTLLGRADDTYESLYLSRRALRLRAGNGRARRRGRARLDESDRQGNRRRRRPGKNARPQPVHRSGRDARSRRPDA